MILEAINYAATYAKTPTEFRPYVRYSVNLWARANRCKQAWAEHEENSRNFILASAAQLRQRRTAVVLGSGLLRDVPLKQLASAFDTVVLIDLVHLASVRARLWRHAKSVVLNYRDLSGFDALQAGKEPEPLSFLRQVPYLDLVISANLLSQIGTGVQHRLEKEPGNVMPDDTLPRLIRAHVDGLCGLPSKVCLITDTGFEVIGKDGAVQQIHDLTHGVQIPKISRQWTWPVVPFGEESRDYQIIHSVVASELA